MSSRDNDAALLGAIHAQTTVVAWVGGCLLGIFLVPPLFAAVPALLAWGLGLGLLVGAIWLVVKTIVWVVNLLTPACRWLMSSWLVRALGRTLGWVLERALGLCSCKPLMYVLGSVLLVLPVLPLVLERYGFGHVYVPDGSIDVVLIPPMLGVLLFVIASNISAEKQSRRAA